MPGIVHEPGEGGVKPLQPSSEPPEDRPRAPERPCPACGAPVDPLRAGSVLLLGDGFRYLCNADCRRRFLEGERHARVAPPPPPPGRPFGTPIGTPASLPAFAGEAVSGRLPDLGFFERAIWVGGFAVACAVLLGFFATSRLPVLASAFFTCAAACAALLASWPAVKDVGFLAWALGPAGAIGAAVGAANSALSGSGSWLGIEGAALASAAMIARAWFDARATRPVAEAVLALLGRLPVTVRVPDRNSIDSSTLSAEVVSVDRVRTGEDVLIAEGDRSGVDGVVQAGEASVLLFPGALTPVRRLPGDPILAGSKVVRGAVRVLASRVGENRALVRLAEFGSVTVRDSAPIARFAGEVTRWGGLTTIALACVVFFLADAGGLTAPISAASAVLLAAPLLAVRRAAESPLVAAASVAGGRGIVYQNANALDLAGRVSVVALSPFGTLTEGRPEVVEVHPLPGSEVESLLALAAAAEEAAGRNPIADAIVKYARSSRVEPRKVRRVAFLPGRGVTALSGGGDELVVGNRKLLLDQGVSVAAAEAVAAAAESNGLTSVFVALGGRVRAVLALQDELRPGVRAAVQRMLDLNLDIALLTGDQRRTVEKFAGDLDITHIKAELLPEERGREVKLLRDTGGKVAFVGHPLDDQPALAAADVSIALGAAGGAAGEYAIALATSDVRDAADALWIARAARERALRATSVAAVAFGVIVAAAATGLIVPAIAAVLAVAVDAHAVRAGARLVRRIGLRLPART